MYTNKHTYMTINTELANIAIDLIHTLSIPNIDDYVNENGGVITDIELTRYCVNEIIDIFSSYNGTEFEFQNWESLYKDYILRLFDCCKAGIFWSSEDDCIAYLA